MSGRKRWMGWGLLLFASVVLTISGCRKQPDVWPEGKWPRIVVTLPALASFAANVAGDDAAISCILQTTGPHEYEPTPHDIFKVRGADCFFVSGLNLDEDFAKKMRDSANNTKLQIVELCKCLPETRLLAMEADDDDDKDKDKKPQPGHEGHHHHHHGAHDPHIWLGVPEAILMVKGIRDELKELDKAHAADYDRRAEAYIGKLNQLQTDGKAMFEDKKSKKVIAFHDSMNYFVRPFELKIAGVIEMQPGATPDAKQMVKLLDACKKQGVRVITSELQYEPKAAERLFEELKKQGVEGVEIVPFDPLETDSADSFTPEKKYGRDFYESKMRQNLNALARALK